MISFDPQTLAQVEAAHPHRSSWVSANAGSGKTRVLTNRVARLLLHGTKPQKILCLTYTKAAAAEMQNRLFERLGEWAMKDDEPLRQDLLELGEDSDFLTIEQIDRARTLFASALETPGGLKIQTIHSFCDDILRRFPVEAGVAPQFNVMDDRTAKRVRGEILDRLALSEENQAFHGFAQRFSGAEFDPLLAEITKKSSRFKRPPMPSDFDLSENETVDGIYAKIFSKNDEDRLAKLLPEWATLNKNTPKATAAIHSALTNPNPSQKLALFEAAFLTSSGKAPFTPKANFPSAGYRKQNPDVTAWLDPLMTQVEQARQVRLNLIAYQRTGAMYDFATAFLKEYTDYKNTQALLDYEDLIERSARLLTTSSMAQWVLYRLDGGIDHILVDEAQDTSPEQWRVIQALFDEFTNGQSASNTERTLFVVGDEKQSIYSFQGADPVVFSEMQDFFAEKLHQADSELYKHDLLYSFRSAPEIMRLVDTLFDQTEQSLFVENVKHIAHFDLPGRVDIWPFLDKETADDPTPWFQPNDMGAPPDVNQVLADQIAAQLLEMLDSNLTIQEGSDPARPLRAGDVLILVQRRSDLFSNIIRALKANGINVAGADKFKVGAELAVRDILSVLKFLATPEDDLSLAEALRSPLLGFSEGDLFSLSHDRKGVLWAALRDKSDVYDHAHSILLDLNRHTDILRPYELIERLLTLHNGRTNLTARLGAEAEDGIDELLFQAMNYEQLAPPTLTGFISWFETDEMMAKRQLDSTPDQVRVMSVHGAKGLEAPVVILPETQHRNSQDRNDLQEWNDGLIHWKSNASEASKAQQLLSKDAKHLNESERMRLLYVAITRAKNWLIICGAGRRDKDQLNWYDRIDRTIDAMNPTNIELNGIGTIKSVHGQRWQDLPKTKSSDDNSYLPKALPTWLVDAAPTLPPRPKVLNPSKLSGAKALPGEGMDKDAATKRGTIIHLLLENLPNLDPLDWANYAQSIDAKDADLAEATTVLQEPSIKHVFEGSLAEIPIVATLPNLDVKMHGIIDRLIISENKVTAVDFKSNVMVPLSVEEIPAGLLAQMGAYDLALRQIYPDHQVEVAILWTSTAKIMSLPHKLVNDALGMAEHLDDNGVRS